jgi:hypothetical protein
MRCQIFGSRSQSCGRRLSISVSRRYVPTGRPFQAVCSRQLLCSLTCIAVSHFAAGIELRLLAARCRAAVWAAQRGSGRNNQPLTIERRHVSRTDHTYGCCKSRCWSPETHDNRASCMFQSGSNLLGSKCHLLLPSSAVGKHVH